MNKENNKKFSFKTDIMTIKAYTRYSVENPEVMPIFMTTAFLEMA